MRVLKKVPVYVDALPGRLPTEQGGHLVHPVQLELGEDGELLSLAGHLLHHGDECWQII